MRYVFCVGMFRSCSTWIYDVTAHLLERKGLGTRLGFLDPGNFAPVREARENSTDLGVLKAHDHHWIYADTIVRKSVRLIYSHRDLRDVAFSYMQKAKLDFNEMMAQGFLDRVLINDRAWRSYPDALILDYETIVEKPTVGLSRIADHLGFTLKDGESEETVKEYSWEQNFKRTLEIQRRARDAGIDLNDPAHVFEHDPKTLLHWNHLRAERSLTWRELASPEELERLGEVCSEWLIEHGYEKDDSWVRQSHGSRYPRPAFWRFLDRIRPSKPAASSNSRNSG